FVSFLTYPPTSYYYSLSLHDALPIFDRRDVQRHRARLDAGQVEQLLRHPQHALRFLVDDLSRTPLLGPGLQAAVDQRLAEADEADRKSTRLNSSHRTNSYAVFCLKKK